MRKLLITIGFVLIALSTIAQVITRAEYYIDEDKGIGANNPISINTGADVTQLFNVPLTSVSEGLHTLYVRAQDSNGKWSIAASRSFFVQDVTRGIVAAEYYIDTDPGIGNAISIPVQAEALEQDISFNVDLSAQPSGLHSLYVRVQDVYGRWSLNTKRLFIVGSQGPENIVGLEYYYTSNGEFVSEHTYMFPNPAPSIEEDFLADASNLINGQSYLIYVWAITESGVKSLVNIEVFTFSEAPPITIATQVTQITCNGENNGIIEATATGGEGTLLYSLDNQTFTENGTFIDLGPGEYTIYVKGDTPDYVESKTVNIIEPTVVELTVLNTREPGCPEDLDGFIEVTATGGTGSYTFQVNNGNTVIESEFSGLDAGTYNITVTDENGCSNSQEVILEYTKPTPEKPTISVKEGVEGISDILTLTTNVAADTYQWYVNGEAVTGATEQDYEVQPSDFTNNASSAFTVEVAFTDGCSITSEVFALTSTADELFESGISVFPNPTRDDFIVSNDLFNGQKLHWYLYDSSGKEVAKTINQISEVQYKVSTRGLSSGLYLLLIDSEDAKAILKIQID